MSNNRVEYYMEEDGIMSNKTGLLHNEEIGLQGLTKSVYNRGKHWDRVDCPLLKTLWKLWITFCMIHYLLYYVNFIHGRGKKITRRMKKLLDKVGEYDYNN